MINPKFKFTNLTRTDLLQYDGINFTNVPIYTIRKLVEWTSEGITSSSLKIGEITKNISLVGHKHITSDIEGLQTTLNNIKDEIELNLNSTLDLSNYVTVSSFYDHINNRGYAQHLTLEQLDNLLSLGNYWKLDSNGNLYSDYNVYSTKEISAYGFGDTGDPSGGSSVIWGDTINNYATLDVDSIIKNVALEGHSHNWNTISNTPTTLEVYGITNAYTKSEVDTLISQIGSGSGSNLMVYSYNNLGQTFDDTISTNTFNAYTINRLASRLYVLENNSGGGGGSIVTWGTSSAGSIPLTVDGVSNSLSLNSHTHNYSPSGHGHGNIANNGAIGSESNLVIVTGNSGVLKAKVKGLSNQFLNGLGEWATVASGSGTVTSVGLTVPTGLSITGSPITASGTLVIGLASGYFIPVTTEQTNWNNAFNDKINSATLTTSYLTLTQQDGGTVTASVPTWNQSTTGTAAKANILANTITIWGQNFNGGANVSGALSGATTISASTSVTVPKIDFGNGWTIENAGTETHFKYNSVIKQKFLSDGSITATGEVTAYTAGESGYSEFLPLSGGIITGNIGLSSSATIGSAASPVTLVGNSFKYNNSDVLYKGNISSAQIPSISLGNGWTIEQTSTALYIKKDGNIKGTFNA